MWYRLNGSFSIVSFRLLFEMVESEKSAAALRPTNFYPDEPVLEAS
jgi:hypothetical protein